jgi:hypothetical protein
MMVCELHVLRDVDFDTVRLLQHQDRVFTRESAPEELEHCKWMNSRSRV